MTTNDGDDELRDGDYVMVAVMILATVMIDVDGNHGVHFAVLVVVLMIEMVKDDKSVQ